MGATGLTGLTWTPAFRKWNVDCAVFIGGSWKLFAAGTPLGNVWEPVDLCDFLELSESFNEVTFVALLVALEFESG